MTTPTKLISLLDWDDTCLASTVLSREATRQKRPIQSIVLSPSLKAQLLRLEITIINFITAMQKYGTIYFVTNSETGWVLLSAIRFLPRVVPYLRGPHAIPVISAIDLYKSKSIAKMPTPTNAATFAAVLVEWKYFAICRILQLEKGHKVYLFSIGDSNDERNAVNRIRVEVPNNSEGQLGYISPMKVRSLKLSDTPTIAGLTRELCALTVNLPYFIYTSIDDDITMRLPETDIVTKSTTSPKALGN